jgi:hypothetical protein
MLLVADHHQWLFDCGQHIYHVAVNVAVDVSSLRGLLVRPWTGQVD